MVSSLHVMEEEHRRFNSLVSEMAEFESNCGRSFIELKKIVEKHADLEEATVMPLLSYMESRIRPTRGVDRISLGKSYGQLLENYGKLLSDHESMRKMLDEIRVETYKIEVSRIAEEILHHMKMEEEIAYPAAVAAGEILHFDRAVQKKFHGAWNTDELPA